MASHGGTIVCLAPGAEFLAYSTLPEAPRFDAERDRIRCDVDAAPVLGVDAVEAIPSVMRVSIRGPLMQYAGFVADGPCGGVYVDGHDAVSARFCAAFEMGDVLAVADSPGGAAAGMFEAIRRAQEAKAKYGRRCTGFTEAMAGSAGFAWLAALCDETFVSRDGRLGSIGARSAHDSRAAADAIEGIAHTALCWPRGGGKLALDPQLPISDVAALRMQRDLDACGLMFAGIVLAGAAGARGLTIQAIEMIDADMLTGEAAVSAGFADGVDSLEAVERYALALAASPEMIDDAAETADGATATGATSATGERAMSLRAEGEEPEDGDEGESEKGPGTDPTPDCKACGSNNDPDAKFCDQCGESMAAKPMVDDAPPPSEKKPAKPGAAAQVHAPPPLMHADASLATILGATGTGAADLKVAALRLRQISDTAKGITGQTEHGKIVGSMLNMPARIERGKQAAMDLDAIKAKTDAAKRKDLAHRIVKAGINTDKVYAPIVNEGGERTGTRIRTKYATMDLAVFEGVVEDLESDAPKKPRNPFEPDPTKAEAAASAADPRQLPSGDPSDAQIEAATRLDAVQQIARQSGRDPKVVARAYLKTKAQNGQVRA